MLSAFTPKCKHGRLEASSPEETPWRPVTQRPWSHVSAASLGAQRGPGGGLLGPPLKSALDSDVCGLRAGRQGGQGCPRPLPAPALHPRGLFSRPQRPWPPASSPYKDPSWTDPSYPHGRLSAESPAEPFSTALARLESGVPLGPLGTCHPAPAGLPAPQCSLCMDVPGCRYLPSASQLRRGGWSTPCALSRPEPRERRGLLSWGFRVERGSQRCTHNTHRRLVC